MRSPFRSISLVAGVVATIFFLIQKDRTNIANEANHMSQSDRIDTEPAKVGSSDEVKVSAKADPTNEKKLPAKQPEEPATIILLTRGNFESFVLRCFQGEPCELSEDPLKLYEEFKISGNRRANDNLISFLRKQLKDPKFRDQYKDYLLKMISDFYAPEEKQFQEAAYYNYLGDLQKSLDLYLDLEKKSSSDPSLRPAPKLNIANTYYDLERYRDALPYYQTALDEYLSRQEQVIIPSTNDMVRFIEGRIGEIKSKVSL